ncbi:MAG: hypothetical protein DMG27_06350 [Acidobacteria bacterium]|nr:MAG: hypothetical protein DMG27_06350 [Acidobacteriota bacterium]
MMTLGETLIAVWHQALADERPAVELEGKRHRVEKTSGKRLRTVSFDYGAHRITGIEQNPRTASRWAELARQGRRIMQFSFQGRYVGNVSEGKLVRYPTWSALGLPD